MNNMLSHITASLRYSLASFVRSDREANPPGETRERRGDDTIPLPLHLISHVVPSGAMMRLLSRDQIEC